MRTAIVALAILTTSASTSAAKDDVESLLAEAQSLKLQYWKFTPDDTISYWDVEFSGDEIRGCEPLLKHAKLRMGRAGWFISCWEGDFNTSNQSFTIRFGEEKVGTRNVMFVLVDKKTKLKRVYDLVGDNARDFNKIINEALISKTANVKPDRIRKRGGSSLAKP